MEAVERGDDLVAAVGLAVEPGELDRRLVGLGSAVAEEEFSREGASTAQSFREQSLLFGVPRVGNVDELANLTADRLDDAWRTVPEQTAAPTGEEVEVGFAFVIPDA